MPEKAVAWRSVSRAVAIFCTRALPWTSSILRIGPPPSLLPAAAEALTRAARWLRPQPSRPPRPTANLRGGAAEEVADRPGQ
eukprot:1975232-Pyramimonas_sp.AAC.2